ncbi:MAG: restriction endonuclease [Euryarchaeota archaeon]|nr:restriction endonuclease [Euryarchaeota archaeon]
MKLELRPELAAGYKSHSQIARVLTERWAQENLYCPACPSDTLDAMHPGKPVIDFTCSNCEEKYQLKSHSKPFGYSVANSAYKHKIEALRRGTIPNYLFLQYDPKVYMVQDLFTIPKHFMSESMIERRPPLTKGARRSGWEGSNILLGNLPLDARIPLIDDGREVPRREVRDTWNRFLFLREQSVHSRGWLADVLACVRKLDETFTLSDVYTFESRLAELHPRNKHVRPKIRQQLQVLRDHGIVEFLERGTYRVGRNSTKPFYSLGPRGRVRWPSRRPGSR